MMDVKYFVVLSAVLVAAGCYDGEITFDTSNIANGEYSYMFSDNLYSKEETRKLDNEGNSIVTGEYRFVLGDKEYIVTYTADKDGYHPKLTISDYQGPPPPAVGVIFAAPAGVVASLLGK